MKKLLGAVLAVAVLGIAGCEDKKDIDDRGEVKKELKELKPGNQTMEERAEKAGEKVEDTAEDVKREVEK